MQLTQKKENLYAARMVEVKQNLRRIFPLIFLMLLVIAPASFAQSNSPAPLPSPTPTASPLEFLSEI